MSDENSIGLQTDPNDISNIERLIKAVDGLSGSLEHLAGAGKGMNDLKQMMVNMQATMVTGFAEMSALAAKAGQDQVAERVKTADRLVAEEEKAWEKLFHTSQAALSKIELAQDAADARRLAAQANTHLKEMEQDMAAENRRAANLQALIEKRDLWLAEDRARQAAADQAASEKRLTQDITAENRRAAALQVAMEKQDLWMTEERGRQLELEQLFQDKRLAVQLAAAEKQRVLNTSFITSPISNQISTAERAAVYSGLGGNAVQRFGSEAAGADLAALRAQYAAMPAVTRASTEGINLHNAAMNEGHALARGLSGSLGALWLTYGSLVPLAAGAAIGASLKNIVEAGKEVEYSLKFVEALGNSPVKVEDFLHVTDGTVVSIKEAAEGMRALSQNGLNAVQSLQILPTILNLSVIGEMSVGAAALSATGVISAFNLQLGDAARVGDVFAQAAASSNTSVALMTESMKQASTVASLYHVTLEETAAGLGELAKINITGSAAGTAFTNMLTGLYSPTAKAEKALKQLQITTDDGQGGLKNSTVLLGELKSALSQYNEQAQTVFLNDIFTTRGTKAASTLLTNLDEYKQRIDDAVNSTGFMSAAVAKLEDTTQGAFMRMKNEIGDSLLKAFNSSSPGLQKLITDLGTLAGSDGAVRTLTAIADAALRVTNLLADHAVAIGVVVAAYGAFKIAATLGPTLQVLAAAIFETSAATFTLAGASSALMAALGPVTLAIGAAVLAWTVFVDKTTEVEKADQRIRNSIDTNIEFLERETKALEERNKAWNPVTQKFDLKPEDQGSTDAALKNYQQAQDRLQNNGAPKGLGDQAWYDNQLKLQANLAEAKQALWKETALQESLAVGRSEEESRKAKANVLTQIEDLVKKGETAKTVGGQIIALDAQGNEKSRAIATSAKNIQDQLLAGAITAKQADIERLALLQQYNAALKPAPEKPDKKAANDRLAAAIAEVAVAKELLKIRQQTQLLDLQAQNKSGALGDIGLLQEKVQLSQAAAAATIAQAKADITLVQGVENKRAAEQKYQNQLAVGREQAKQDALQAMISADAAVEQLRQANLKVEAENYQKRGQLLDAFLVKYEADHGIAIAKVAADLERVRVALAGAAEDPFADPQNTAKLNTYNDAMSRYLANQKQAKDEGVNTSIFQETKQKLDSMLASLTSSLSQAKAQGQEEGGLSGAIGVSAAAQNLKDNLLPEIQTLQVKLEKIATGTPALETLARQSSKSISTAALELGKAAQPFGDAWTEIWKKVESGAHDTWLSIGKNGTDTLKKLGDTIKTTILDMLYQLTLKKWVINVGASLSNTLLGGGDSAATQIASATSAASAPGASGNSAIAAVNAANSIYKLSSGAGLAANVGGGISSFGGMIGSSTIAEFGSGFSGSAAVAAEALGAEMTTAASAGAAFSSALATAVPWIAAAVLAYKAWGAFFEDGPEKNTRLTFTSNNSAGNISINDRGNEGKNAAYIAGSGTGAFGTFGVASTLWSPAESKTVQDFITNVTKADDVFSRYLTSAETASVKTALTGKNFNAYTGAEGADQNNPDPNNPNGAHPLDQVFSSRLNTIFESVQTGMSKLLDGFVGTAQQLADEGSAILAFRAGLTGTMQTVYGATVTLEQLAALKTPTETVSAALNRVQADFTATNQVALALGKTTAEAFGAVGLASYNAREQLITLAGGTSALTSQVNSFAANYLTNAERLVPVSKALDTALASLSLTSIPTTRDEFKNLVQGLDLTDAAQQKTFVSLMALQDAFAQVHPAVDATAGAVNTLTDQLALQARLYAANGDAAGAAAILEKQHQLALEGLTPAMADLTKQVWAAEAAATARKNLDDAYKRESDSLKDVITKTQTFSDTINKYKASLVLSDLSPLTPQQKYLEAKAQFEKTYAAAQGGDTTAQANFTSAADAFLKASQTANASSNQFVQDYEKVRQATENTAAWAQTQVDVAKASLAALDKQVAGLLTVDNSVKSVAQAILDLGKLMGGDTQATNNTNAIESLYESLLGRKGEEGGMKFWTDALKNGVSITQIAQDFISSPEYQKLHATTSAATTPGTTKRVVMGGNIASGNEDPVAAQLAVLIQQNAQQTEEIRQLRAEQKSMMAAQVQADYNTAMAAAGQVSAATGAAADKIIGANQTKVAPK